MSGSRSGETVQETLARSRYMWKTLTGLAILLGSRFRGNDKYWFFAQSREGVLHTIVSLI